MREERALDDAIVDLRSDKFGLEDPVTMARASVRSIVDLPTFVMASVPVTNPR